MGLIDTSVPNRHKKGSRDLAKGACPDLCYYRVIAVRLKKSCIHEKDATCSISMYIQINIYIYRKYVVITFYDIAVMSNGKEELIP